MRSVVTPRYVLPANRLSDWSRGPHGGLRPQRVVANPRYVTYRARDLGMHRADVQGCGVY